MKSLISIILSLESQEHYNNMLFINLIKVNSYYGRQDRLCLPDVGYSEERGN